MKKNEKPKPKRVRRSYQSEMQWAWAGFDPSEDIWTSDDIDDLGMLERPQ